MNRKDFIKFRTYIVMAKRVYIYVNMHQEGQEGEYVKLSKKDLIDRLDMLYKDNKDNWQSIIDINAFHFHTKDSKVWYFGRKWLGRPEEVYID